MTVATTDPVAGAVISVDLLRAAVRSEAFPKWSTVVRRKALARYEKFLRLAARYPEVKVAPCRDIDEFWHLHMLHPVAYARDCERMFGGILDHDGGFGATAEEAPQLASAFDETARLWKLEYGEEYAGAGRTTGSKKCTRNCVSRCKRACKTN